MAIDPWRMILGPMVADHDPGWADRAGAVGYPDAELVGLGGDDEYTCVHCRRGQCARCTDRDCSCCAGYPDPDERIGPP